MRDEVINKDHKDYTYIPLVIFCACFVLYIIGLSMFCLWKYYSVADLLYGSQRNDYL